MLSLSKEELIEQLKLTLETLSQKESDLIKAAEFGQQLLSENSALKLSNSATLEYDSQDQDDLISKIKALQSTIVSNQHSYESSNAALTRKYEAIQAELQAALKAHVKAEKQHNDIVNAMTLDLEKVKNHLNVVQRQKQALEEYKKKSKRENGSDSEGLLLQIRDLENNVNLLANAKKESDKKLASLASELDSERARNSELAMQVNSATELKEEFDRRGDLIHQLQEQIEDLRAGTTIQSNESYPGEVLSLISPESKSNWDWYPWLQNVKDKAMATDIAGLRQEISDLTFNREVVYKKVREDMDSLVLSLVQAYVPEQVTSAAGSIVGIVSGATGINLGVAPAKTVDLHTANE